MSEMTPQKRKWKRRKKRMKAGKRAERGGSRLVWHQAVCAVHGHRVQVGFCPRNLPIPIARCRKNQCHYRTASRLNITESSAFYPADPMTTKEHPLPANRLLPCQSDRFDLIGRVVCQRICQPATKPDPIKMSNQKNQTPSGHQ